MAATGRLERLEISVGGLSRVELVDRLSSRGAAETLSADHGYPKGFYLRVVHGQAWLRGYRCDDEHP